MLNPEILVGGQQSRLPEFEWTKQGLTGGDSGHKQTGFSLILPLHKHIEVIEFTCTCLYEFIKMNIGKRRGNRTTCLRVSLLLMFGDVYG